VNKNKQIITDIVQYNFHTKKFYLTKNVSFRASLIRDPNFWFVIQRVLSPRKMKSLISNTVKNEVFNTSWVEYFTYKNYHPDSYSFKENIPILKEICSLKLINSVYMLEANFKQYVKYLNYPKVIDIPKIEVNFL